MTHAWEPTVLAPARLDLGKPEVRWWPHCSRCGAQTTGTFHRASARDEWTREETQCMSATETERGT